MKSQTQDQPDGTRSLLFECPGCDMLHAVSVNGTKRPNWTWNGSIETPTLSPSVLVTYPWGEQQKQRRCHSFVRDGQIQFLADCTHALAGKTVPLPDIDL